MGSPTARGSSSASSEHLLRVSGPEFDRGVLDAVIVPRDDYRDVEVLAQALRLVRRTPIRAAAVPSATAGCTG
jgi:hypothetical protein